MLKFLQGVLGVNVPLAEIRVNMSKKKQSKGIPLPVVQNAEELTTPPGVKPNSPASMGMIVLNELMTMRQNLMKKMMVDPKRDIDAECGYPSEVTPQTAYAFWEREAIANRVVSIYPEESFAVRPDIWDDDDEAVTTEFEMAWESLLNSYGLWGYLSRADEISGIGRFGIILLGISDGKILDQPVIGTFVENHPGEPDFNPAEGNQGYKLLYLRPFAEVDVQIGSYVQDVTSPRFGQPEFYLVNMLNPQSFGGQPQAAIGTANQKQTKVHWTRVLHVADNLKGSELFGLSRLTVTFNRLYDLRKILGGSAEMFWKGGYPGISFELNPNVADSGLYSINKDEIKEEMEAFMNGLQKYIATEGLSAKTLQIQIAAPEQHFDIQITAICIAIGAPKRKFMGSEQGELASSEDVTVWNTRVAKRQNEYITPRIIRRLISRFQSFGVMPLSKDNRYKVEWPDLNAPSDEMKASTAAKMANALAQYSTSDAHFIVQPLDFLTTFLGIPNAAANQIIENSGESIKNLQIRFEADTAPEPEPVAPVNTGRPKVA